MWQPDYGKASQVLSWDFNVLYLSAYFPSFKITHQRETSATHPISSAVGSKLKAGIKLPNSTAAN